MTHVNPTVYLVWTILSGMLNLFLLFHLWSFDKFQCIKWNSKAHAGAFKRFMTYSYLITVPMIFSFSFGNVIIKYQQGFVLLPPYGIIPKPYQFWGALSRSTIFPLTLVFSVAWSLEMVTHLEELCFWLYLVNAGSVQQQWFHSPYFKTWVIGSVIAIAYMPVVTILTRADPLRCEAFTLLAGSIGSLSLTVWFTPILYVFPSFLRNLRTEGVDISTIIRLTKVSELNAIRVAMRYLFAVPLLILAVDGVRTKHHVNENMFATDLLCSLAGFGVVISSGITLVIFFPRSIEGEIASRDETKEKKRSRRAGTQTISNGTHGFRQQDTYLLTSSPVVKPPRELRDTYGYQNDEERDAADIPLPTKPQIHKFSGADHASHSTSIRTKRGVNPMIFNFTSPIDLVYEPSYVAK